MRLSGVQDDTAALARVGWAVRRLTGGPGQRWICPISSIATTLRTGVDAEPFHGTRGRLARSDGEAADLHPITRACMGFHLWSLAGLGQHGDRMEAAVTAGRIAASEGKVALFAPLSMGGAGGLRSGGPPPTACRVGSTGWRLHA